MESKIKLDKKWIVEFAVAILGCIAAYVALVPVIRDLVKPPPPSSQISELAVLVNESSVRVPANQYWYDTHLQVLKGDWLAFAAGGSWWNGLSMTGPEGDGGFLGWSRPECGECPIAEGNLGHLIGKVDAGPPFSIGRSSVRLLNTSGSLFLAMNENKGRCKDNREGSCYDDNNGALEVKVTTRRVK